ncbi:hypothetical protein O6H91_10G104600 [Diphasiastrum complanatum]|uniref:Uncharacterized protein n=1 Tax=Diphasiastrum complanatum TaxID=34168 RepID=A0ACC2CKZ0_DIPCM|nr:hypothetical protein O6H91_10G104600 [Diphasiastrum complanatum]
MAFQQWCLPFYLEIRLCWKPSKVGSYTQRFEPLVCHDGWTIDSDSEYDSEDESGEEYESAPSSPSSQPSRTSSISRHERRPRSSSLKRFFQVVTRPFIHLFGRGPWSFKEPDRKQGSRSFSARRSDSSGSLTRVYRQLSTMKDFVMHRTTDSRRRGIIEDLQFLVELSIEKVFDAMHKVLHHIISPLETLKLLVKRFLFKEPAQVLETTTTILGNSDPSPTWRQPRSDQPLNTDARTCEDMITDLGYPYEAIRVTTEDGYILLLERIPRRDSRKVLYLQHGLLDSSLGWVSNGAVGSQAFAAYDQGYDVFLGNFRGLASKEHVDKSISSERYWNYTVNEHGTQDIPAMISKLHEMKISELTSLVVVPDKDSSEDEPYKVCAIAHSLGGAAMLMYVVTRRVTGRPHHLSRLVLFSPAGFHKDGPGLFYLLQYLFPAMGPILRRLVPGIYIPTRFLRMLLNKVSRDFQNYPALGGLAQRIFSYCVGGDSSNWIGAFGMSHYNMYDMPGVAYRVAEHLAQMMRCEKFIMFDYGSQSANMEAYGTPFPFDIGKNYGVIDIPVDVVAGTKDRLIPRSMVLRHYETLKRAGVQASYEEFEYAHLDFTFREELIAYVMARLLLVFSKKDTCDTSKLLSVLNKEMNGHQGSLRDRSKKIK